MRIYVDELPESCEKCKFYKYEIEHDGEWGFETHRRICKINGSLIQGICPLHSLADYTKQVRKEVCEEIRKFIHSGEYDNFGIEYLRTGLAVLEKLDQIQGETK